MSDDTIFLFAACTAESDTGRMWANHVALECECRCEAAVCTTCCECDVCERRGRHAPTEYRRVNAVRV